MFQKCLVAGLALAWPAASMAWVVNSLHPLGAQKSYANFTTQGQQAGIVQIAGTLNAGIWSGTAGSFVNLHPNGYFGSGLSSTTGSQQAGVADLFVNNGIFAHAGLWSGTAASFVDLHPTGPYRSSVANAIVPGLEGGYVEFNTAGKHASLWSGTASSWVDIHPNAAQESYISGMAPGQQVGTAYINFGTHASLWSGTAASWVDLHPTGTLASEAYATDGTTQVGYADMPNFMFHASAWTGSASSWVDLNPNSATSSTAYGAFGGFQVGSSTVGGLDRASLWSGSAASWVDLGAYAPNIYSRTYATGLWTDGTTTIVSGWGFDTNTGEEEALIWTDVVPEPSTLTFMAVAAVTVGLKRRRNKVA